MRLLALVLAVLAGCGGVPVAVDGALEPAVARPSGEVRGFAYRAIDGRIVRSADLRGRMTVVGFVASYDPASQAQARFLAMLARRHTPRINALLLVLEPHENQPLAEAFAAALDLPFPVAMADEETLAGRGPFAGLHHVPSVVLLDREGREVWRRLGLVEHAELEQAVRRFE